MTGMGFCDFCKKTVPTLDLLVHITQVHEFKPERWPDGGVVEIPADMQPADFLGFDYTPLTDEEAAILYDAAMSRLPLWRRAANWLRTRLDKDQ